MIVIINPNLVVQRRDPFTTGIVYMPIGLAYIAASLQSDNIPITIIDAFANKPYQAQQEGNFMLLGLTKQDVIDKIPNDVKAFFIYAINIINHVSTITLVETVKKRYPHIPVIILENVHSVTSYALKFVANEFYNSGADYILTGELEYSSVVLAKTLLNNNLSEIKDIKGLGSHDFYNPPSPVFGILDKLPFPAWDLFPLENYWKLHFAHGPQSTKNYLPLLTSRGCPYGCRFCITPFNNKRKWRSRTAENVVDEIEHFVNKYQCREFHLEDMNPTISDQRIRDICNEILKRNLNITWKIVSGTKVETIIDKNTVNIMAKAGCSYISISPETGSPEILKHMNKPFNLEHAIGIIKEANRVGIRTQACFVLGFPGENYEDLEMTWNLVKKLTKVGIDEIALFIITPIPGTDIYDQFDNRYNTLSELNFSPSWRTDYNKLNNFRLRLYMSFLLWKIRYYPGKIVNQIYNFFRRSFETKMEMIPYRALTFIFIDIITMAVSKNKKLTSK